jgi:hypothetical protein
MSSLHAIIAPKMTKGMTALENNFMEPLGIMQFCDSAHERYEWPCVAETVALANGAADNHADGDEVQAQSLKYRSQGFGNF